MRMLRRRRIVAKVNANPRVAVGRPVVDRLERHGAAVRQQCHRGHRHWEIQQLCNNRWRWPSARERARKKPAWGSRESCQQIAASHRWRPGFYPLGSPSGKGPTLAPYSPQPPPSATHRRRTPDPPTHIPSNHPPRDAGATTPRLYDSWGYDSTWRLGASPPKLFLQA